MTEQIWETELARGINESQQFPGSLQAHLYVSIIDLSVNLSEGMTSLWGALWQCTDSDTFALSCLSYIWALWVFFLFPSSRQKWKRVPRLLVHSMIEKCLPFKAISLPAWYHKEAFLTKLAFAFPSVTMHLAYFAHFSLSMLKIIMKCLFPLHRTTLFQGSQLREEKKRGALEEVREQGWAEGWLSGSRDHKRCDQILTLLRRHRPQSRPPMGIRILRQWKDGTVSKS